MESEHYCAKIQTDKIFWAIYAGDNLWAECGTVCLLSAILGWRQATLSSRVRLSMARISLDIICCLEHRAVGLMAHLR